MSLLEPYTRPPWGWVGAQGLPRLHEDLGGRHADLQALDVVQLLHRSLGRGQLAVAAEEGADDEHPRLGPDLLEHLGADGTPVHLEEVVGVTE
jgi:hypothetical protein